MGQLKMFRFVQSPIGLVQSPQKEVADGAHSYRLDVLRGGPGQITAELAARPINKFLTLEPCFALTFLQVATCVTQQSVYGGFAPRGKGDGVGLLRHIS
jgi:hypothetical protein